MINYNLNFFQFAIQNVSPIILCVRTIRFNFDMKITNIFRIF